MLPIVVSQSGFIVSVVIWTIFVVVFLYFLSIGLFRFWQVRHQDAVSKRRPKVVALFVVFFSFTIIFKFTFQLINLKIQGVDTDDYVSRMNCYMSFLIPANVAVVTNAMLFMRQFLLVFDLYATNASMQYDNSKTKTLTSKQSTDIPSPSMSSRRDFEEKDLRDSMMTTMTTNTTFEETFRQFRAHPELILNQWQLKYRHYFRKRYLSAILLVIVVMIQFIFTLIAWDDASALITVDKSRGCLVFKRYFEALSLVFVFLDIIAMTSALLLLRKKEESFGIKAELFRIALVYCFIVIMRGTNLLSNFQIETQINDVLFGSAQGFALFDYCFPLVVVLYESLYRTISKAIDPLGSKKTPVTGDVKSLIPANILECAPQDQFEWLLNNPEGFQIFREYLAKELSVENLLFWKDVENFHIGKISGFAVYETYIRDFAPLLVNLPHPIRNRIIRHFENLKTKKFDPGETLMKPLINSELQPAQVFDFRVEAKIEDFSSTLSSETTSNCQHLAESEGENCRFVFDEAQRRIFLLMLRDPFSRFQKAHGLVKLNQS
jgi:hypothetical protein